MHRCIAFMAGCGIGRLAAREVVGRPGDRAQALAREIDRGAGQRTRRQGKEGDLFVYPVADGRLAGIGEPEIRTEGSDVTIRAQGCGRPSNTSR